MVAFRADIRDILSHKNKTALHLCQLLKTCIRYSNLQKNFLQIICLTKYRKSRKFFATKIWQPMVYNLHTFSGQRLYRSNRTFLVPIKICSLCLGVTFIFLYWSVTFIFLYWSFFLSAIYKSCEPHMASC